MSLQKLPTVFEIMQGIWNPADRKHSWIVVESFDTMKEARVELDRIIGETFTTEELLNFKRRSDMREAYRGAPLAILEVRRSVMERWNGEGTRGLPVYEEAVDG